MAVIPGMGGTPDQPPGYTPPDQPGVAAGTPNIIRARQVIIVGSGGELLVYSPTAGAGNLIAAIAGSNGTDVPYGNPFFQGIQSINGNLVALLESGALFLQAASGQISGGFAGEVSAVVGNPGEVFVSSGGASGGDATSQIDLRSQTAGGGTSQCTLTAQQVIANNALTVGTTLTVSGTGATIGNGTTANITLSPKMATPPNLAAVVAQTATLAQTQACLGAIVQSMQNRGLVN